MDGQPGSKVKQLAALLAGLDRAFRDDFKRSNGVPCDLTLAQYQVISKVAECIKCSQKDIADFLGVTGPTVVRIIDALEKKELVRRTRDEQDRRIVLVSLTDKGVEIQRECTVLHEQKLSAVMDRLPSRTADALLVNLSDLLSAARVPR
jgi:DNA-binding MarR family transcriptional regulator